MLELVQQTLQRDSAINTVVISLQAAVPTTTSQGRAPAILISNGLAQLCQELGIIYLQATDLDQLGQLVQRYRDAYQVLIDTTAALLQDPVALATLVTENEILPHLCLAIDAAPWVIDVLAESTPWISASVLLTRFDLAGELEPTLNALEARSAQISGVSGHLVEEAIEERQKGNSPSTLEE